MRLVHTYALPLRSSLQHALMAQQCARRSRIFWSKIVSIARESKRPGYGARQIFASAQNIGPTLWYGG